MKVQHDFHLIFILCQWGREILAHIMKESTLDFLFDGANNLQLTEFLFLYKLYIIYQLNAIDLQYFYYQKRSANFGSNYGKK